LLPPVQIVSAVEAALRAQESERIVASKRLHMQWGSNTLFAMSAATEGELEVKIVSVVPDNTARGFP
jgi:ornithine cyclodeaminase/alanine dehydrogenase-like protein (mu-crystallin family)